MSFLAPLYALAALAIAAPILFHFLQRKPQGQQDFSSLMFLRPSPPQLTKRNRISNLLLLILRGLALLLLAAAFARPFLRSASLLDLDAPSRSVALVVDTSASLRRAGMWDRTKKAIDEVVKDLRPTDHVSLIAYNRKPETLISFEAWADADASRRVPMLREQVQALDCSWYATRLDTALIFAADALLQQRLIEDHKQPLQVILFSDLQEGSDLEALQSYQWPEEVAVDLRICSASEKTNASLQVLPPAADEMDAAQVRVLVRNEADSSEAQFKLAWAATAGELSPVNVHVPPGQTRVVRITQPSAAQCLTLSGDDNEFDNQLYATETTPQQKRLLFIGDEGADRQSLLFYLRQATLDTRSQQVSIEKLEDLTELATLKPKQCPLIVLAQPVENTAFDDLQRYVRAGGRLLVVLQQGVAVAPMSQFLATLLDVPDLIIEPAEVDRKYAMLARIDFENRLFAPFADPRFGDFAMIRFWKHHRLMSSHEEPWSVVARFDDQLPALVEKSVEEGTVWIMTSGWQPSESQLALSTKFVPLLHGMFAQGEDSLVRATSYEVGQTMKISPTKEPTIIIGPDGETFTLSAMTDGFEETHMPGIFGVRQGEEQFDVAVNMPSLESRTQPLTPDRLEQLGVRLGEQKKVETIEDEQRQMRNIELESRQKLWRWGIIVALLAIACETWIAGRSGQAHEGEPSPT